MDTIYCTKCGEKNEENYYKCIRCDSLLHTSQPQYAVDNSLSGFIPAKNIPALVGYYLGVFSLIPVLGMPLGITAVILGILGINRVKANPSVKGKNHALTGIVLGGLSTLIHTILILSMLGDSLTTNT